MNREKSNLTKGHTFAEPLDFSTLKKSREWRGSGRPAISQSYLQRQFNELILVRVAAFGEGLEDLREKKEL